MLIQNKAKKYVGGKMEEETHILKEFAISTIN